MKNKILETACKLFLSLGFKSVTMDEIAAALGVSKKTIYTHFTTKTMLVGEATNLVLDTVCSGINLIHQQEKNPIIELFEIKRFVMKHLNDEKSSPQYQLQKYYPKIYNSLKDKQFNVMQKSIKENLTRGIEMNLFRKAIHIDFIARIYFHGITGIKDKGVFPTQEYSINNLMNYFLEYHIRGICTPEGIQVLENQLQQKL